MHVGQVGLKGRSVRLRCDPVHSRRAIAAPLVSGFPQPCHVDQVGPRPARPGGVLTCLLGHPLKSRGDRWGAPGLAGRARPPTFGPVSPALPWVPWAVVPPRPGLRLAGRPSGRGSTTTASRPSRPASRGAGGASPWPAAPLWVPSPARGRREAACPRQGAWSPGSPPLPGNRVQATTGAPTCPSAPCDDLPRAQTPVVSWWLRRGAPRTAAFRPLHTVGVPLPPAEGSPHGPPLYQFRSSLTRPVTGLPLAPRRHGWWRTEGSLLTGWRGVRQVGLAPAVRTHRVTITSFMPVHPIPRFRASLGASSEWFGQKQRVSSSDSGYHKTSSAFVRTLEQSATQCQSRWGESHSEIRGYHRENSRVLHR